MILEMRVLLGQHAGGEAGQWIGAKMEFWREHFVDAASIMFFLLSPLLSSSDPLLSPPSLPQRQSTQWGRLADQGVREGGRAANSGVRVGWSAGESSGFRPNNATRGHGT